MIKFINTADLLNVRNEVLRENRLTPKECRFQGDDAEGSFHLGYFDDATLVSIATFHRQNLTDYDGSGYQLRGMATVESHQGKGLGSRLVDFAMACLKDRQVNYVWCNARKKAVRFYQNMGFEIISEEFEIPIIGPHYVMHVKIQ